MRSEAGSDGSKGAKFCNQYLEQENRWRKQVCNGPSDAVFAMQIDGPVSFVGEIETDRMQ